MGERADRLRRRHAGPVLSLIAVGRSTPEQSIQTTPSSATDDGSSAILHPSSTRLEERLLNCIHLFRNSFTEALVSETIESFFMSNSRSLSARSFADSSTTLHGLSASEGTPTLVCLRPFGAGLDGEHLVHSLARRSQHRETHTSLSHSGQRRRGAWGTQLQFSQRAFIGIKPSIRRGLFKNPVR